MKPASLTNLTRRGLLRSGGALVVSFTLPSFAQTGLDSEAGKPLDPKQVDSFLAVHADGSVTVYCGKVDLGTGLRIAVRQIAAEELDVPLNRVTLVEGDTALTPDQGSTGGSTGLTRGGIEVRQAAATARAALDRMAAAQGRPASAIGQLIGGKRFAIVSDTKAQLKSPTAYNTVGKSSPRPDLPAKCTGTHNYVHDHKVTGMLHARVLRGPSPGAKLVSFDPGSIKAIPGAQVVRIESFLAVVAEDEWAAIRGSRELKAQWTETSSLPGNAGLERYLREGTVTRVEKVVEKGDAATALKTAAKQHVATYQWPNQSHGSIGPSCAIADVKDGSATVWSSSQGPHGLRVNLARILKFPEDRVRVVYLDGAGCYGSNGNDDVAADAALLSNAVKKPVRVQWMRQDEHGWDPKGPQQLIDMKAGSDAQGKIVSWQADMRLPVTKPGSRPLLGPQSAGLPQDAGQNSGLLSQNADPPYTAQNVAVNAYWLENTPLRPSNLRAPGKIANVFAAESITDEIAAAAGADPITWRTAGLTDTRALDVIKRVKEMSQWETRPSPKKQTGRVRTGRGFAYARYKQAENYVAMAMEVAVDTTTGKINVQQVWCAHDCGLIVNPDALKNQIEGQILQTLSRTMFEEVKFDRTKVTSLDWATYPILRFPDVPTIEIAMINRPVLPLYGAGEASCAPVAAALANAVFDATGVRLRSVPFTPDRVKAALA